MKNSAPILPACLGSFLLFALCSCGVVTIDSEPAGAKLYLNGQYRGTSPMTVQYSFLEVPGSIAQVVLPGYTLEDCPTLSTAGMALGGTTAPAGAKFYKDGQYAFTSPGYDPFPGVPHNWRIVWPKEVLDKAAKYKPDSAGSPGKL